MKKNITQAEFLEALDIVETYMAQIRAERDLIIEGKKQALSLERFMDKMGPSTRLCTALKNYQEKWGINPCVMDMTDKKLNKTLGMGKQTKSEFISLREEFIKKCRV